MINIRKKLQNDDALPCRRAIGRNMAESQAIWVVAPQPASSTCFAKTWYKPLAC
jgi:uncharacterized lipoprotein YmbA